MEGKALYLLAHFDERTEATLAGYGRRLWDRGFIGRQTRDVPHHITLGSLDTSHERRLAEELDAICGQVSAFDIRLAHIGLFGLSVLFVVPNMNFELLSLQSSFFPGGGRGHHPWSAHVTLLIDEPDAIMRALPVVNDHFKPIDARIESVGLYEFFPARFIKECSLRGGR